MSNITIPDTPDFSTVMRQLEQTDPAAAELFNNMFARLLQNDAFLKLMVDNSVKKTVLKFAPSGEQRLVDYISSLISTNETVGSILISDENGTSPIDIPSVFKGLVFCEYQSYGNNYVEVKLTDNDSSLSYYNKFVYGNNEWMLEWLEIASPDGYLKSTGGTITGDFAIDKTNPVFYLLTKVGGSAIAKNETTSKRGLQILDYADKTDVSNYTILEVNDLQDIERRVTLSDIENGVETRYVLYGSHNLSILESMFAKVDSKMTIRTGTAAPTDDIGEDGDIYIQIIE